MYPSTFTPPQRGAPKPAPPPPPGSLGLGLGGATASSSVGRPGGAAARATASGAIGCAYGVPCAQGTSQLAFWLQAPMPPDADDDQYQLGAEEVMATFEKDRWLVAPTPASSAAGRSRGQGISGQSLGEQQGGLSPAVPAPDYSFRHLRSPAAKQIVSSLLAATSAHQAAGASRARRFGQALEDFVNQSFALMTSQGRSVIPNEEKTLLVQETDQAMRFLVRTGHLNVAEDLVFSLEAFGISRHRPQHEKDFVCKCLGTLLRAALDSAAPDDVQGWFQQVEGRVRTESGELYSNVDVRAWPTILDLAKLDHSVLQGKDLAQQIQFQLCIHSELHEWSAGLTQASALIRELHVAQHIEPDKIREIFNDKVHFPARQRRKYLVDVLSFAPKTHVEDVLQGIDENDTDLAEPFDPEMEHLKNLIRDLDVDIHCCKNAYFSMQRDWLIDRHRGITVNQKLTPEQICDHIETDPSHEELLKVAVKSLLSQNRKFEAARMLARPQSNGSRVAETNKNDKQLSYLISLYKDVEPPPDDFGPIEEDALVLGRPVEELLYVDDLGNHMDKLEEDLLSSARPDAVGIWWTWRCLDPSLQLRPRAEFIAIAYSSAMAIVDFKFLEENGQVAEERGKDIVRRILAAEHLLKVTHDLDRRALKALQHALVMQDDHYYGSQQAVLSGISPVIDLTIPVAFTRRVVPGAPAVTVLSKLTFEYLRLELCLAEALSNFERRPLRLTQLHYALTLAWSPLTILRVLCAHGILHTSHLHPMALRLGFAGSDVPWDDSMRQMRLSHEVVRSADNDDDVAAIPGPYAENLWENPEWVYNVPKPDNEYPFPLADTIKNTPNLGPLVVPPSAGLAAACGTLLNQQAAARELRELYQAHRGRPQQY